MVYRIKDYTYNQANRLGVKVYPSKRKNKKLDVFSDDHKYYLCSIGDIRYKDYPTYIEDEGQKIADEHRLAYRRRHYKELDKVGSPGWFASLLLW